MRAGGGMEREEQARRIQNVCLMVLAALATGFVLFWLRNVMIPFVLAVFIANGLGPLVDVQIARLHFPRILAVFFTLVLAIAALAVVALFVSSSLRELTENASVYQRQIEQLVERVLTSSWMDRLEISERTDPEDLRSLIPIDQLRPMLLGTTNAIFDLLGKGFIVSIFLLFLLLGEAVPSVGTRADIQHKVRRYIVVQGALSLTTGVLVGGILALLGVPLAMVFGLCAFLLNFIPSIGSVIATLLPLPVVLVSPEITPTVAVLAIVLPALVQVSIGNVISPKVMGDSLDLHPVAILLALMVWGALWGVVGMLLATPITAVMRMLFQRMELTQPVADLLAGRPRESARASA